MKKRVKVGVIDLGVHSYAPSKDLLQNFVDLYAKHNRCVCVSRFDDYYHKLSGLKRSVSVAAFFVWKFKKLVYVCEKKRLDEILDAIHVAVRCGRQFEVYVIDRERGIPSLMQVDFSLRKQT